MDKEKDYTYRSMRDEREYGLYWYSGLWHVLRPILVALTVIVLVIGIGMTVWGKLYGSFLAPADEQDTQRFSGISTLLFSKPEVSQFLLSEMRLQQALADIFRIVTEAADIDMAMPGIEG